MGLMAPAVSVVIPAFDERETIRRTLEEISTYLRGTGLSHEILVVDDGSTDGTREVVADVAEYTPELRLLTLPVNRGKGCAVRRGAQEASGDVVAFIDADLPYSLQNFGDAVALVQTGATDIAIGARDLAESSADRSYPLLRRFMGKTFSYVIRAALLPRIPDTQCGLKAYSAAAAKLLFGESRLNGFGFDFEVLFLAQKYGFRIERIPVTLTHRHQSKVRIFRDSARMLMDVVRVRWWNRRGAYRAPRRCPVCFSSEVGTLTQIERWVVRQCGRCKCRYLATFPDAEELERLYESDYFASSSDLERGYATPELTPAIRRTTEKRLARLRKLVPGQARILEIGSGAGHFGALASREFSYVGIDLSPEAVSEARRRNVEAYRASLADFVNLGPPFDAVALFHVFEHLPDPHDALARVKELLRPGGIVVIITPDTESVLCWISGDRWVSYKFPEHLILYSRSALIELLEHSGFEIVSVHGDAEYCDHEFLVSRVSQLNPSMGKLAKVVLPLLPDPIAVGSGSLRIVARRRAGPPLEMRPLRTAEPTHAR
jgi:dolichyl-phosphate beta-glucosyltransferase